MLRGIGSGTIILLFFSPIHPLSRFRANAHGHSCLVQLVIAVISLSSQWIAPDRLHAVLESIAH
ncbi:MAG: hypothetical protein ACXVBZ_01615 [Flavisolibacter sp.]